MRNYFLLFCFILKLPARLYFSLCIDAYFLGLRVPNKYRQRISRHYVSVASCSGGYYPSPKAFNVIFHLIFFVFYFLFYYFINSLVEFLEHWVMFEAL